jgi:two-component system chemotaxis sensor kinase CheA
VLSLRLLPVSQAFNRFPRLLREIAGSLGKPARLVLEGEATEADKSVVDALFEPLLHGIRNALDHGIETQAERENVGKAAVATIRLRAAREGEQLRVEVEDDGRGVDVAAVRAAAAQRCLLPPDALAVLTDEQAIDLVFAPGFSTAAAVTGLSGRGVGMDVVRRAVERMGGRALLESRSGRGTTLRLTLPFSLMLTRVMTVERTGRSLDYPSTRWSRRCGSPGAESCLWGRREPSCSAIEPCRSWPSGRPSDEPLAWQTRRRRTSSSWPSGTSLAASKSSVWGLKWR